MVSLSCNGCSYCKCTLHILTLLTGIHIGIHIRGSHGNRSVLLSLNSGKVIGSITVISNLKPVYVNH